jgi:hypothetical protein
VLGRGGSWEAPEEEGEVAVLGEDNEACLAWLAEALQQLRPEGRTKVVGYLEAVLEEVVFETKVALGA